MPTCKEDAQLLLNFALFELDVPVDNILLMCSEKNFEFITKRQFWNENDENFRRWMNRPHGDQAAGFKGVDDSLPPIVKLRYNMISRFIDQKTFEEIE